MREWAMLGLLVLTGCDQARALGLVKNDPACVQLMPAVEHQRMLAEAYPSAGYQMPDGESPPKLDDPLATDPMLHSWLLADCLIVKSRQMASDQDASSVVAKAVSSACQLEINQLAGMREFESVRAHATPLLDDGTTVQKAAETEALRYVVEARSLQCRVVRPNQDARGWPSKPEIQELE